MEIENPKSLEQRRSIEIVAAIDDLLTEILFRLPVEPLIRCELVSKRCQSLITNPNFRRRRNLNPVPAVGLFLSGKNFRTSRSYDYIPFTPKNSTAIAPFSRLNFTGPHSLGNRIIQSCNGLFLCSSVTPGRNRNYAPTYYVYKPTTNQFTTLPFPSPTARIRGMSLAFDPTRSSHYQVVCVCSLDGLVDYPYQVVRVCRLDGLLQINIYSSKTSAWRKIGEPFTAKLFIGNGVYWNNAIHWINKSYDEDTHSLYFNLHRNVLEKMPTPPFDVGYRGNLYYFGESCGHLLHICLPGNQTRFNVYEMKRDYSEWFVKYSVDLSPVVAANHEIVRTKYGRTFFSFDVCCVVRDEEKDGSFLVVQIPGKVIRYNLVSQTFEKLHEFEEAADHVEFATAFQYFGCRSCV